jgi:hypothetical protein
MVVRSLRGRTDEIPQCHALGSCTFIALDHRDTLMEVVMKALIFAAALAAMLLN